MSLLISLLKWVPKNLTSYFVGLFFRIFLPYPLNVAYLRLLAFLFRIDLKEAEKPLSYYHSFEELFIRKLKPGLRPIEAGKDIVSPADGTLIHWHSLDQDFSAARLVVKGVSYDLSELVYGSYPHPPETGFKPSGFFTIYLAPHNYHRVHSPVQGKLTSILYHPGTLWPVNGPFVRRVPNLFSINERVTFSIETDSQIFHVVMVGALNVGRISSPFFPEFLTNNLLRQVTFSKMSLDLKILPAPVAQGDELGTFQLGSTVVVVIENRNFPEKTSGAPLPQKVTMGASLA